MEKWGTIKISAWRDKGFHFPLKHLAPAQICHNTGAIHISHLHKDMIRCAIQAQMSLVLFYVWYTIKQQNFFSQYLFQLIKKIYTQYTLFTISI